ncbi:hypothetical protein VV867_17310 [Pseudomonas sp. JH-2]|uniref:hypothetical protein n=1 Tax=Pseudomonas sp. JH-2 TaxID=3114998 RepID=UPI002E264F16|nr:hypothetical protein [Pseudomonas sp. JH-2]
MINTGKLEAELSHSFPKSRIFMSPEKVPASHSYPAEWKGFGVTHAYSPWIPAKWERFKDHLPWTFNLLKKVLIGTALLSDDEPKLIYIFRDTDGFYFYLGAPPISNNRPQKAKTQELPEDIKYFYLNLHNGFTFYPSQSMGPLPIELQVNISDLYDGDSPSFISKLTGLLHNGAGDYLCINPQKKSGHASIWWHEAPDKIETGFNFWKVMDTWISVFLEDTIIQREL